MRGCNQGAKEWCARKPPDSELIFAISVNSGTGQPFLSRVCLLPSPALPPCADPDPLQIGARTSPRPGKPHTPGSSAVPGAASARETRRTWLSRSMSASSRRPRGSPGRRRSCRWRRSRPRRASCIAPVQHGVDEHLIVLGLGVRRHGQGLPGRRRAEGRRGARCSRIFTREDLGFDAVAVSTFRKAACNPSWPAYDDQHQSQILPSAAPAGGW